MVALDIDNFLEHDWQRRPRLIRRGVARSASLVSRDELFALAGRDDVPSRVVELGSDATIARLRHGPFTPATLQALPGVGWTLLVQEVDRHLPACAELLERFRFVPNWRIDDVMVSHAVDGGGIGAHTDRYDVFLVQASGRRRWRIGERLDEEWLLEPGDVLYLPPGVPHEGVAVGECLTCSIGFRVPDPRELVASFITSLGPEAFERYSEQERAAPVRLGEIAPAAREALGASARALFDERFEHWIGRYVTRPLRTTPVGASVEALWSRLEAGAALRRLAPTHFAWFADARGVVWLFVGGEAHRLGRRREEPAELLCGKAPLDAQSLLPHRERGRFVEALVDAILRGYLRWE